VERGNPGQGVRWKLRSKLPNDLRTKRKRWTGNPGPRMFREGAEIAMVLVSVETQGMCVERPGPAVPPKGS
jgi:hypothetical protein